MGVERQEYLRHTLMLSVLPYKTDTPNNSTLQKNGTHTRDAYWNNGNEYINKKKTT